MVGAETEFHARLRLARSRVESRAKRRHGLESVSAPKGKHFQTKVRDCMVGYKVQKKKISSVWCSNRNTK